VGVEAVVALLADDAPAAKREVHGAVGPEARSGSEGRRVGRERSAPDDARRDRVAVDKVADDLEALIAHEPATLGQRREHLPRIALAPTGAEEVGPLDDAHLRIQADLDLSLAALFAGYALNDEVQRRLHDAGFEGLRFSDGFLIQHLVEGARTVGELADLMGITQQAVSKTVGELEALGYLERRASSADARVRLVRLTGRGREAIEAARRARREVIGELRVALGARRVDAATAVLREVLGAQGAQPDIRRRRVRPPA
jgi:DNA-binding MarR family transcriptional regulator